MTAADYAERYFRAQDGLRLYYRDYGNPHSPRPPLLCLAGLTRNSKDFHDIACRHAEARRVIALDFRGRGRSDYDPDYRNYQVLVYLSDVLHLLVVTQCHRVVVLGTSMGGLVAMAMGAANPASLVGVILNDIGPEIASLGKQRIVSDLGADIHFPDYQAAAAAWQKSGAGIYPKMEAAGWLKLAQTTFTEDKRRGGVRPDYDPKIARAMDEQSKEPVPDLWPLFRGLRNVPVLTLRGALSDLLSAETLVRMKREHAGMTPVTVPDVGHAPMLDEPVAQTAIDDFLAHL
ncbi:MAG TPA: alpha/beta hydrolase [Ferrovibrio sp.]|uniref:alpha/beta fold hydrolase n=1 Tax=Ferrovibrio sp. TaxID=1917215 RepID=UPI002ED62675